MLFNADSLNRATPIDRNRELLKDSHQEIYKIVDGHELMAYMWEPPAEAMVEYPKSVIAFFFSSGWDNGQVSQFAPHCLYFASRGMLAIAFDYRVASRHGAGPIHAISDARSAMRWLRYNADTLGINPGKIVGAGGSGGAHAIASAALLSEFDEPDESLEISCSPNALALFNPILDTSKKGFGMDRFPTPDLAKRANLMNAIAKGRVPSIIFHGTGDRVVSYENSFVFAKKMKKKKNICEYVPYEGQGHGFFNLNVSSDFYQSTVGYLDEFLVKQGFLEASSQNIFDY